jgi:glycosyltransferase involved in cell wall biosynthesis
MPLLTVLMPVFNAEKYLYEAIESILQQTFTDFEFLIIDDGSTDSSAEIIKSFNDPRINFIQNLVNVGVSETLNKGIGLSNTELIARMDSDDICYPERLQKQYDHFQTDPECALLSASARVISATGGFVRIDQYPSAYYYYNLNFICWIYHPTVMYKRSCVIDAGQYSEPYAEDFNLWWQLALKYKISHLQDVLLDYRLTAESLSMISKKKEYEIAQHEQVIRNIHYLTGEEFDLTFEEVECYRFNFEPLLKTKSTAAILQAIKKLKYITTCIIDTPNVNLDIKAVQEAFHYKKEFTLHYCYSNLPLEKKLQLKISMLLRKLCVLD